MFPVLQQLLLNSLKTKEEDFPALKSIKESIAQNLSTQYREHALKSMLKMTAFSYLTESEKTAVILNTREELADLIEKCMTISDPPTADLVVNLDEDPPPPKKKRHVSALLGELFNSFSEASSTRTAEVTSHIDVQQYTVEEQLDLNLSQLVRRLYCNTATSCPSERFFSAAGNLVTEKRNCLLPENVDRMVFLCENLNEEPLLLNEEDEGSEDEFIGEAEN